MRFLTDFVKGSIIGWAILFGVLLIAGIVSVSLH